MAQMTTLQKKIRARVVTLNEIQKYLYNGRITFSVKKRVQKGSTTYIVERKYSEGSIQRSDAKTEFEIVSFLDGFVKHYNRA